MPFSRARHKCWQKSRGLFQRTHLNTHLHTLSLTKTDTTHSHTPPPHNNLTGHSHEVPNLYYAVGGKRYGCISQLPPSRRPLYPLWWAMDGWMDGCDVLVASAVRSGLSNSSQFRAWPCAARVGPSCQSLKLYSLITEVSNRVQFLFITTA